MESDAPRGDDRTGVDGVKGAATLIAGFGARRRGAACCARLKSANAAFMSRAQQAAPLRPRETPDQFLNRIAIVCLLLVALVAFGRNAVAAPQRGAFRGAVRAGGEGFVGSGLAVGTNADGRLELFAITVAGNAAHIWQEPGGGWSGWESLGGSFAGDPAVAANADGRFELFVRGSDDELVHAWQLPDGGWSSWESLGGRPAGGPTIGVNADGSPEIFVRWDDGALYHAWRQGGEWSDWESLGGSLGGDPAVAANPDGRLEVFARMADGTLAHRWQAPAGGWSAWESPGTLPTDGRGG